MTLKLEGQQFGRLTAVRREGSRDKRALWLCRCVCGNEVTVQTDYLRSGDTKSCGCLRSENGRTNGQKSSHEVPSYEAAHQRIRRHRGKPSEHRCVDCGSPACDWSYDHSDPDELTAPITLPDRKTVIDAPYSAKPEHYSPRCRGCHIKLDRYSGVATYV